MVVEQARARRLLSDEPLTVDGTLIEAWASHKSFRPKGKRGGKGSDSAANFHGNKRRNQTHESTSDPDSRLFRKGEGKEAKLSYMAHVLTENRNGLVVEDVELTQAHVRDRVGWMFTFAAAAYNLVRMRNLLEATT